MKRLLRRAGTPFKRSGRFDSFEIIAGLAGANAARVPPSHLQAFGRILTNASSGWVGGLVLLTALAILVARSSHDVPAVSRVSAPSIEARISSSLETRPFMYAGVRG